MTERASERANGVTGSVWVVRFYYLAHELKCSSAQLNSTRAAEYLLYFYPLHGPRGDVRAFFTQFPPLRWTPATASLSLRYHFVLPPYQISISFLG